MPFCSIDEYRASFADNYLELINISAPVKHKPSSAVTHDASTAVVNEPTTVVLHEPSSPAKQGDQNLRTSLDSCQIYCRFSKALLCFFFFSFFLFVFF